MLLSSLCLMVQNQGNNAYSVVSRICSYISNPNRLFTHDLGLYCPDALSSEDNNFVLFDETSAQLVKTNSSDLVSICSRFCGIATWKLSQPVEYFFIFDTHSQHSKQYSHCCLWKIHAWTLCWIGKYSYLYTLSQLTEIKGSERKQSRKTSSLNLPTSRTG